MRLVDDTSYEGMLWISSEKLRPIQKSIVIVDHILEISTAPTKAKSRKPAYSQALFQNKINRQGVRARKSERIAPPI